MSPRRCRRARAFHVSRPRSLAAFYLSAVCHTCDCALAGRSLTHRPSGRMLSGASELSTVHGWLLAWLPFSPSSSETLLDRRIETSSPAAGREGSLPEHDGQIRVGEMLRGRILAWKAQTRLVMHSPIRRPEMSERWHLIMCQQRRTDG